MKISAKAVQENGGTRQTSSYAARQMQPVPDVPAFYKTGPERRGAQSRRAELQAALCQPELSFRAGDLPARFCQQSLLQSAKIVSEIVTRQSRGSDDSFQRSLNQEEPASRSPRHPDAPSFSGAMRRPAKRTAQAFMCKTR
jgi:hypothetical protein